MASSLILIASHRNAPDREPKASDRPPIRNLPLPDKGQKVYYEASGLGVRVSQGGSRSFVVQIGKSRKRVTLGRYPAMSLQEARKAAFRLTDASEPKSASTGLAATVSAYLADCEEKNRASTVREYRRMLALIDKPLADVGKTDLKRPTSHQVSCWRIFFNWCIKHDLTDRNLFLHLPVSVGKRERVLSDDELRRLWHYDDPPFSDLVKLMICTGQRRGELWRLRPEWVDGDLVTVPAAHYKTNRIHLYPFGELARPYIEKAPFSFNGWSKSKRRMDQATGVTGYRLHDLRRSDVTIHARIGTRIEVSEKLVGHVTGTTGGIVGVYNRHQYLDEMRAAVVRF